MHTYPSELQILLNISIYIVRNTDYTITQEILLVTFGLQHSLPFTVNIPEF